MCSTAVQFCVLLSELCPNRGRACVRSYGESNNTSGLVACEQPEAKANLRPNTQAVLGFPPLVPARITSPRDSSGHLPRLVSYQTFQGSLRSFVPRFSYLSNTSPPASCLALLPLLRLSTFLFILTFLPPSYIPPLTSFFLCIASSFSFSSLLQSDRGTGSLNPPVMVHCIFLRRS